MMFFGPLENHLQGSSRHLSLDHASVDLYQNLLILIPGVEVRRLVIIVVHEDHNAIEATQCRHAFSFSLYLA
jgi:hypothetical protein